jgi:uncharacterized phage protein (TIGR01671 family)
MREILFRGKSLVTSNWVYGNYIIDKWGDDNNKTIYEILTDRTAPDYLQDWIPVRVNPDTIGQYTGRKDKNGKEIYEGDIVYFTDKDYCLKVEWVEYGWALSDEAVTVSLTETLAKQCTVLGNVYDNPGLIGE